MSPAKKSRQVINENLFWREHKVVNSPACKGINDNEYEVTQPLGFYNLVFV